MGSIEWKNYIQEVRHPEVAVIDESNYIEFCKQFGGSVSFREVTCAPYPDGRKTLTVIKWIPSGRMRVEEQTLPFAVQLRGDHAYHTIIDDRNWRLA